MSEANFTKGEWSIEPHGDGFALYAGRSGVAHGLNLFNIKEVDRNFEANAALIEAAPEMYEMLEDCMCQIFNNLDDEESKELVRKIIKIRKKARGEQ